MLETLASPVGYLLAFIHSALSTVFIPSSGPAWALSIVLLTVCVRLLLFPLFVKQIKSQRRMQELSPRIKELQKAHKGDRETMNAEMMKLYKENNANPISGCLPLLLQLPVFFALFTVIRKFSLTATEQFGLSTEQLREGAQAKVFGAPISATFQSPASLLNDLGAEISTVRVVAAVMVVLMGATTFYTQRQMIARAGTSDPQQIMVQKLLLYVLPLSFAVSGVFFPIGVLLYWLTTNIWSMGQQAWVIKRMPPVNLTPGKSSPSGKDGGGKDGGGKDGGGKDGGGRDGGGKGGPAKGASRSVLTSAATDGTPDAAAASEGGTVPAVVGSRHAGATPKPAVSAAGNRRPAGSRKNKSRRGGRR